MSMYTGAEKGRGYAVQTQAQPPKGLPPQLPLL